MENGKINKLDIVRKDQKGFYLQDKKGKEIFLSKEEMGKDLETGSSIDVLSTKIAHKKSVPGCLLFRWMNSPF